MLKPLTVDLKRPVPVKQKAERVRWNSKYRRDVRQGKARGNVNLENKPTLSVIANDDN